MINTTCFIFIRYIVLGLFAITYAKSQPLDSLEYYSNKSQFSKLRDITAKKISSEMYSEKDLYYYVVSLQLDNSDQSILMIDSMLSLPLFGQNFVWKDRVSSLRISFLRKSGEYHKAIADGIALFNYTNDTLARFTAARAISISYRKLDQYDSSMRWAILLEKSARKKKDNLEIHRALQNMANLYDALNELSKALEIEKQLITIADKLGNVDLQVLDRCNIGSSFTNLKLYDSAYLYFKKALNLALLNHNVKREALIRYNIGSLEHENNNYTKAANSLLMCLPIAGKTVQPNISTLAHYLLADCYFNLKENNKMLEHLKLGYDIARKHGYKKSKLFLMELEFKIYEQKKDYSKAIKVLQRIRLLEDGILNEEKVITIKKLEAKFEMQKKNNEIELLTSNSNVQRLIIQQQRVLIFGVITGVIVVFVFFILFTRQQNLKKNMHTINMKNQLLRSQMNPHFLYNALGAIQQFIHTEKTPVEVSDYIGKFSRLTRMILDYSREEFVTLDQEVSFLEKYIDIQQFRFNHSFDYSINIGEELSTHNLFIPPMISQPFIENAIEHGIRQKRERGKLEIIIKAINAQRIKITIKDNGIGRKATLIKGNKSHQSLATKITKDRIEVLGKKYKLQTKLKIEDIINNEAGVIGTIVSITLPLINEKND